MSNNVASKLKTTQMQTIDILGGILWNSYKTKLVSHYNITVADKMYPNAHKCYFWSIFFLSNLVKLKWYFISGTTW